MRILHTADWHLGCRLRGRNRHDEQVAALEEICRIADDQKVDLVIVAGDLFDAYTPPAESETLAYATLSRLAKGGERCVLVIAGNHDSPERLTAANPYAAPQGVIVLGLPTDRPLSGTYGACSVLESAPSFLRLQVASGERANLLALPYPSESRLREVFTSTIDDEQQELADYNDRLRRFMGEAARGFRGGETNLIASHLFVAGGSESGVERPIQVGGAYTVTPSSFPSEAAYVALGHLHRPQEFESPSGAPVRYSGSILQHSFSEAGQEKSVTIIESDGVTLRTEIIPLSAGRRLHQIVVEGGIDDLDRHLEGVAPEDWLALTIVTSESIEPERLDAIRRAHPTMVDFLVKYDRREEAADVGVSELLGMPLSEQFRRYVETQFDEVVDDAVVALLEELASGGR